MDSKKLFEILPDFLEHKLLGSDRVDVCGLAMDSRTVQNGTMFVAVSGLNVDGHNFVDQAIQKGASVVLLEKMPTQLSEGVTYVQVEDSKLALGFIASAFFDHPSKQLNLVGITGTNGKSTTATLMFNLWRMMGVRAGLLSTIKYAYGDYEESATHTTPDAIKINSLFAQMLKEGCTHVVMEVSSHAIDQYRTKGLDFDIAVFTNLSHDHIGYHGSFLNYINAKKKLFDELKKDAFAIVNEDDPKSEIMIQNCAAHIKTYGLRSMSDFKGKILSNTLEGLAIRLNGIEFHTALVGEYNAYNLIAVYAILDCLGMASEEVISKLSSLKGVDGRFEMVVNQKKKIFGIVDYAHTPDALEKVLENIQSIKRKDQKLVTVIGCGGNRDRTKRPVMAKIAAKLSDQFILTNDNPRTENPESILDEMEKGLTDEYKKNMLRIADRSLAIKTAVMLANENAIILVAGKGHEKYQEVNGEKLPFDDVQMLKTTLL